MTEILTESFCERCGTRYTFESKAPRKSRLGRVRTVSKGLRNFVLSDETTLSEAMADARSEVELATTASQLDAFHQTFNFCMSCRQYTCGSCWNAVEGRCLTCAPVATLEIVAPLDAIELPAIVFEEPLAMGDPEDEAWPDIDLSADRLARALGDAPSAAGPLPASVAFEWPEEASVGEGLPAEPVWGSEADADVSPTATTDLEPELGAHPAIRGLEPGQTLADAIAAWEAQLPPESGRLVAEPEPEPEPVAAIAEPEPEPVAAIAEPEPEPVAAIAELEPEPVFAEPEPEPEPVAAIAQPEPEPVFAEPEPEPEPVAAIAEPEPEVQAVPAPVRDVVPQPTWPAAGRPEPSAVPSAPEPPAPPMGQPAQWLAVAPDVPMQDAPAAPQWPTAGTPAWGARAARSEPPRTLAGRPLVATETALWDASSREVLAPVPAAPTATPTAQPCVSCGLSLSANARFCRRCGTRQG